uniref:Transposase n=1 Tax=Ditylenchus dipsaci TaxID=166011 RepID=A0A915D068_9BILA
MKAQQMISAKKMEKDLQSFFCNNCRRKKYWSGQKRVGDTSQYEGTLRVVAAAVVAPVAYPELSAFFDSAGIAGLSVSTYQRLARSFVWPTVNKIYEEKEQKFIVQTIERSTLNPIHISLDGQYDSPGYSAELCCVAAIDNESKQVMRFEAVQKNETGNVSTRMELEGVKRCIQGLEESGIIIKSVTTDRHSQIRAYMASEKPELEHDFDAWHMLKSIRRNIVNEAKKKCNKELKEAGPRFMNHLWHSTALPRAGVHSWSQGVVPQVIHDNTSNLATAREWSNKRSMRPLNISGTFETERFTKVLSCNHEVLNSIENTRVPLNPASSSFAILLKMVSSNQFLADISRLNGSNSTCSVESFHSIANIYRPKRKFYSKRGFIGRTQLGVMHFNENKKAELRGDRLVVSVRKVHSNQKWKRLIVDEAVKRRETTSTDYLEMEELYDGFSIIEEGHFMEENFSDPDLELQFDDDDFVY